MPGVIIKLIIFALLFSLSNGISPGDSNRNFIMWTVRWSPAVPYIAAGGYNSEVLLFDANTFKLKKVIPIGQGVLRLAWHPTQSLLAVAAEGEASCLIDVRDYSVKKLAGISLGTRSIDWNHDGTLLASANYDENITIYTTDGDLITKIDSASTKSFVGLDWHPGRNEIITLSDSVRIFDLEGNVILRHTHRDQEVLMLSVQWHPTGSHYAIGDYGDYDLDYPPLLQYFDTMGNRIFSSAESTAEYRNLRWSADGSLLATASDALRVWTKEGELKYEGPSSSSLLWGVDWRPDMQYVITSDEDGIIKLWNQQAQFVQELN